MSKVAWLLTLLLTCSLFSYGDDSIEFIYHGDSLSIWHYSAWRNCGAIYIMDLNIIDSTIYLMENDTSRNWYRCNCNFDLATTISTPAPGQYHLIIRTTNIFNGDTALVADTTLVIDEARLISYFDPKCLNIPKNLIEYLDIPLIEHFESECLDTEVSLTVRSEGDNVVIDWNTNPINPNVTPWWQGYISNDTFYVTMDDTSIYNLYLCSHYLNARFGPVPSGKYILSFMDGAFGYPTFIVNEEYSIEVEGNELIINWSVADLNCCLEPLWESWFEGDVFHITMTDTGGLCNCLCPFELTARFGPFQPGTYTVNFHNSSQEPVEITINNLGKTLTITQLSSYQSDCYNPNAVEPESQIPVNYPLLYCYPNPFNATTNIEFFIPTADYIEIDIYSITGSLVHTILTGSVEAGVYSEQWDAGAVPSGLYFVRLKNLGSIQLTKKILLLK
ncbi:T9SS type A sorting domain-containing protein [bacterium]|nr:T9SS type A sorting domain-containing protein [bacterium]MBU1065267.1 T9SS type A sorting domain-containing protein [bacterium]MBU1634709.1 T9SS type A sorting domain-containing protein [bacterium]